MDVIPSLFIARFSAFAQTHDEIIDSFARYVRISAVHDRPCFERMQFIADRPHVLVPDRGTRVTACLMFVSFERAADAVEYRLLFGGDPD